MEENKEQNWIFIRGLTRGEGHWGVFPEEFKREFSKANIEFLDLPGSGSRNHEVSPLKIEDYVIAIRSQSRMIKEKKKVFLLSISLGGMVAALWQDIFPDEIEGFVLINSSFNEMPPWKRFNLRNLPKIASLLRQKSTLKKEDVITRMICNHESNRLKNLPLLVEYSEKYPIRASTFFRQLFAASQFKLPASSKVPVLVLGSKGDRLVSFECTKKLAQKWQSPIHLHEDAGHDIPIDDPKWLIDLIRHSFFTR